MAAVQYGQLTAPVWGTTDETTIILENISKKGSTEESLLVNGQGDIEQAAYHGGNYEVTASFKVKATGYPDHTLIGGYIVLAGDFAGTYIVKDVTNTKEAAGWMGGDMTLRAFPSITITTTTTTTATTSA